MESTPLAQLLVARREALGLRQEDVFDRLVVAGAPIENRQTVSTWETGRSVPGPRAWAAICTVYGIDLTTLAHAIAGEEVTRG